MENSSPLAPYHSFGEADLFDSLHLGQLTEQGFRRAFTSWQLKYISIIFIGFWMN